MRRRLALAASSASILSLILAATAFAGGWANAVMDTPPNDPAGPNEPVTLGFTLLQHGETPVDWGSAQIVLTNEQSGQEIVATAAPNGPIGHWSADVMLPAEGSWSYQVRHDLEITLMHAQPITVGSSQAATTGGATAIGISPALLAAGGFLALLAMALLAGALLVVRRSPPDNVRA